MELRTYLRVVALKLWVVIPTFLITFLASIVLTFQQAPTYESVATYVVSLSPVQLDDRAQLDALGALRSPEIVGTFVEVANSRLIGSQAATQLGLSEDQVRQIAVISRSVPGTNVVQIVVQGPEPTLVRDFASTVGARAATSFRGLYGMYALQLLDDASVPNSPVKPSVVLNLLMGALTGLLLGVGMAFLSYYLQTPARTADDEQSRDDETDEHPGNVLAEPRVLVATNEHSLAEATPGQSPQS